MGDTASADAPEFSDDGRVERRQRNRERIVDAYVQLLEEGVGNPTAAALAARADLTARSVYRHLQVDSTLRADVAQRIIEPFRSVSISDASASTVQRIEDFVTASLAIYDRRAPVMRAVGRTASSDPLVVDTIGVIQGIVREQLAVAFAPELEMFGPEEKEAELTAMHTPLLFESITYLHRHVAQNRVAEVLRRQLRAVLSTRDLDQWEAHPSET